MEKKEIQRAFKMFFSLKDGLSDERDSRKRYLSDVKHMFLQKAEAERRLKVENPFIYEFYELGIPQDSGELAFGTSIT